MITLELIKKEYDLAIVDCSKLIPLSRWKIQPASLELTNHKGKYGMASASGVVFVNEAFIGTDSIVKLKNTLRHELAHLAVGLHHHHNKNFKRCESFFGALARVSESEIEAIEKNISFKWRVIAHMACGKVQDLGGVHRKTKIYSEYPENGKRFKINQALVSRFEFMPWAA